MRTLYFAAVISIFLSSFFSSPTILPHMMWPECEFRMQVWNVLHEARSQYRMQKKNAKNRQQHTIAQFCPAIFSQLRHVSTIGKKLFQQQYLLHMSSEYDELQPTNGWDWLGSLWHPSKFDGFHVLVSLLHRRSAEANQTLQHGTRNGNTELCLGLYSEGGHHVGRRPTF